MITARWPAFVIFGRVPLLYYLLHLFVLPFEWLSLLFLGHIRERPLAFEIPPNAVRNSGCPTDFTR